jgi:hypothetical protein
MFSIKNNSQVKPFILKEFLILFNIYSNIFVL